MPNISPKQEITAILRELFPDLHVTTRIFKYVGQIHAFFVRFPSAEALDTKWEHLSNAIAVYYQTKLESEFEIWNLYLFCVTSADVEKGIKYKIENDTVSSRKILITHDGETDDRFIDQTITEHITNENLQLLSAESLVKNTDKDFARNPLIWNAIIASGIINGKKIADEKNLSLLEELEKQIKNEIQKG